MRTVRRALFITVAILAVVFAIANRQVVLLNLWPLPWEASLPLYLIVLCALGLGLLLGAAASWLSKERMWLRARGAERKAGDLQRAVDRAREREETTRRQPPARPALAPAARAARIGDD